MKLYAFSDKQNVVELFCSFLVSMHIFSVVV